MYAESYRAYMLGDEKCATLPIRSPLRNIAIGQSDQSAGDTPPAVLALPTPTNHYGTTAIPQLPNAAGLRVLLSDSVTVTAEDPAFDRACVVRASVASANRRQRHRDPRCVSAETSLTRRWLSGAADVPAGQRWRQAAEDRAISGAEEPPASSARSSACCWTCVPEDGETATLTDRQEGEEICSVGKRCGCSRFRE